MSNQYAREFENNKKELQDLYDGNHKSEYRAKATKLCADLVEQYTTTTEMTSELIQALIDKIYIYE